MCVCVCVCVKVYTLYIIIITIKDAASELIFIQIKSREKLLVFLNRLLKNNSPRFLQ
jgi:hypothetical protein